MAGNTKKKTLRIQENKDKNNCTVKMINPKDLSKASESEKNACAMVINQITKALKEIQD